MSFESVVKSAMVQAAAIFGTITMTWDGDDYDVVQSDERVGDSLEAGGFLDMTESYVVAVKDDFPTLPKSGDMITLDGKQHRILSVVTSKGDPGLQINYSTKDK